MKARMLLAAMFVLGLSSCAVNPIKTRELGDVTNPNKVLIASQRGEFKAAVADKVAEELKGAPCAITVVDVRYLSAERAKDSKAVIILCAVNMGRLHPKAAAFIGDKDNLPRTMLVATSRNGKWKPANEAVDAVSSASVSSETDELAKKIAAKVKPLLAK